MGILGKRATDLDGRSFFSCQLIVILGMSTE